MFKIIEQNYRRVSDAKVTIKKGDQLIINIEKTIFPNIGISYVNGTEIRVKNTIHGQKIKIIIKKKKKEYYEGKLLEIIENSPLEILPECEHFDECGGCSRQGINYKNQLELKENQVEELFKKNIPGNNRFHEIIASPRIFEYRNKMEFSFGDLDKNGILQLGMHPAGKRFDVITVDQCKLVDKDFRVILFTILDYFRNHNYKRYHIINREGYLRHLVIRKGLKTGEIMINIITTSQEEHNFAPLNTILKELKLEGKLVGFLQTINNDYSDAIKCEKLIIHYGRNYILEEILGLSFKITPFAFFQTNTFAAEKLYQTVKSFVNNGKDKIIYDLYCGTGTITQILAKTAKSIYGIEINEEAVEIARENAEINNLDNCTFIPGDVLEKIDELKEKPDLIVIDPPRPGIHPKALKKITDFSSNELIYVSCNPVSLVQDLKILLKANYKITDIQCVDMFPHTHHIETVVHLNIS